MKCERCKTKQATMKLTRVINNQKFEVNLCEDCAWETGQAIMPSLNDLGTMLSGLLGYNSVHSSVATQKTKVCTGCGMSLEQIASIGRLGCDQCYTSFYDYLKPLLKKIQGNNQHVDSSPLHNSCDEITVPTELQDNSDEMNLLKVKLKEAIGYENFELAVELRDKIKIIENDGVNNNG